VDNKRFEFELVVERIKKQFLYKTDKKFSDAIGMTPTAFNNRKNTASLPYPEIIEFANKNNINLNWILTGDGPVYKNDVTLHANGSASNLTKVIFEHQDLVRRFKNPQRAKEINEDLLLLEDVDDDGIEEVKKIIKIKLEIKGVLKKSDGKDKKIS